MTHHTKVLAIVANYGVEQDELLVPVRHLRDDGVRVDIAAPDRGDIRTPVRDRRPGETVRPTHALGGIDPTDYDLLLIPGGTLNADSLRLRLEAVAVVLAFTTSGRPVAAIRHDRLTGEGPYGRRFARIRTGRCGRRATGQRAVTGTGSGGARPSR
ncbi:DJ-1/PfpI family protein [Kitasatospora sp. NPDC018058]|uniref:DJ-1/PfpI family protein n=1 Tax=Kitasatospora sp. NPDC018058 TaxID=3364025 RepID=UPI0037BF0842